MKKENATIKNRASKAELRGEHSYLDYHIVASRKIISEIYQAIIDIEHKYDMIWLMRKKP